MNHEAILKRLDEERRSLAWDGDVLELLPDVTRLRSINNRRHTIIYSSLTAENADAAIVREIEHHRRLGEEFEWKVYTHDQPADLRNRLARHGFQIGPCEAFVVHEAAEWIAEHRVCAVENLEQVQLFRRVAEEIFAKNYELTATELEQGIKTGSTQHVGYIAYVGDEPAGVGRLYTNPKSAFGGFFGGGTRSAFRGQGVYRALVAARSRDALARGSRYLLVDALPTSRPILERLGFERIADTWPCTWEPQET